MLNRRNAQPLAHNRGTSQLTNYMNLAKTAFELRKKYGNFLAEDPVIAELIESDRKKSAKPAQKPATLQKRQAKGTRKSAAVVAVGSSFGKSYIALSGTPQILTDQTGNNKFGGVRVSFQDVLPTQVAQPASATVLNGSVVQPFQYGPFWRTYHYITPTAISNRLSAIAEMYEFYAFREITFEYVPYDATSIQGSVAMGFVRDPGSYVDAGASLTNIMQTEGSSAAQVWLGNKVTLKFKGTKLWQTLIHDAVNAVEPSRIEDYLQSLLIVGLCGVQTTTAQVHGFIRVTGICDLYRECPTARPGNIAEEITFDMRKAMCREWMNSFMIDHHHRQFVDWYKKFGRNFKVLHLKNHARACALLVEDEKKEE